MTTTWSMSASPGLSRTTWAPPAATTRPSTGSSVCSSRTPGTRVGPVTGPGRGSRRPPNGTAPVAELGSLDDNQGGGKGAGAAEETARCSVSDDARPGPWPWGRCGARSTYGSSSAVGTSRRRGVPSSCPMSWAGWSLIMRAASPIASAAVARNRRATIPEVLRVGVSWSCRQRADAAGPIAWLAACSEVAADTSAPTHGESGTTPWSGPPGPGGRAASPSCRASAPVSRRRRRRSSAWSISTRASVEVPTSRIHARRSRARRSSAVLSATRSPRRSPGPGPVDRSGRVAGRTKPWPVLIGASRSTARVARRRAAAPGSAGRCHGPAPSPG
ncbi:hypothetical protein [Ornithinimicrobium kibberense]|uniref:hypothetical protein n=1 Tax=Ornithinimicrobium kibberense TaxID=282060 RepID=UPI0036100F79